MLANKINKYTQKKITQKKSHSCFVNIFGFDRYDEENCNADDWQPFNVSGNGIAEPFSKPASPIKAQFIY